MPTLDRPKLRPLNARRFDRDGQSYALLQDPLGAFTDPVLVPLQAFVHICRYFDGQMSVSEIQSAVRTETGQLVPREVIEGLVLQLDRALVLEGPTFAAFHESFRRSSLRPAALAGRSYANSDPALRSQLMSYFRNAEGAGPPALGGPDRAARIRGILCPHIDFHRGGPVYTWSYRVLAEHSNVDTFVILGVAHQYCRRRFALTSKDFQTPLGTVRTDRQYVERIAQAAGGELFDDELVHLAEHSIEFQIVFLQYVLGPERPFSIVPILVGSFHDHIERGTEPIDDPEVGRFVEALRVAERAHGKNVVYIGGIDLCHVGPEFGDPLPVDPPFQNEVRQFDRELLEHAAAGKPVDWFRTAARVSNRWRVCGLAATYTMLHAMGPARGRLLRYDQAINDQRTCCVSFASMVFDVNEPTCPGGEAATIDGESNT
jgi:AmmeMemoRadiSam system protein B